MKKSLKTFIISLVLCGVLAPSAFAEAKSGAQKERRGKSKHYQEYSIADALKSDEAKARLTPNIELYFGLGNTGDKELIAGFTQANHKNALKYFGSIKEACDDAFVIALTKIQQQAQQAGGNSALNIVSLTSNSAQTYECLVRALDVKVTLKSLFGK